MPLSGPSMIMDSRESIANYSLSFRVAWKAYLIAMMRVKFQRASYRDLFRPRELTTDSTDAQLIGYPKGQPAHMW